MSLNQKCHGCQSDTPYYLRVAERVMVPCCGKFACETALKNTSRPQDAIWFLKEGQNIGPILSLKEGESPCVCRCDRCIECNARGGSHCGIGKRCLYPRTDLPNG